MALCFTQLTLHKFLDKKDADTHEIEVDSHSDRLVAAPRRIPARLYACHPAGWQCFVTDCATGRHHQIVMPT